MPTISIRLSEEEKELIKEAAKLNNKTTSLFIKETILEYMEDEYDYNLGVERMKQHLKDPVTYSNEEVMEEYGK